MKKLSVLLLTAVVSFVSLQAIAGGNELSYFRLQELPIIATAGVDQAADYEAVYDASLGKVVRKLAKDSDAFVATLGAAETLTTSSAGKTLCFGSAAGTATLPAASGTGLIYRFTACAIPPTSGYVVKVADASDTIDGQVTSTQDSGDTVVGWETASDSDTITFTSSTKMSATIGAWVELQDIAADQWVVRGQGTSTGSEATPFSAAVP